jgi:hypothetical protein
MYVKSDFHIFKFPQKRYEKQQLNMLIHTYMHLSIAVFGRCNLHTLRLAPRPQTNERSSIEVYTADTASGPNVHYTRSSVLCEYVSEVHATSISLRVQECDMCSS